MEAIISTGDTAQPQQRTTKDYKSPPHALIWFFRKSRDLTWRKVGLDLANSSCLILALLLRYGNRKVFRTTLHQERRMEATISTVDTAQPQQRTTKDYKSPPHALIWFFRKSRDLWKCKYQVLQRTLKQLKNRVADLTKSREQWKLKAEQANNQLTVLEAENDRLRTHVATLAEKKTTGPSKG